MKVKLVLQASKALLTESAEEMFDLIMNKYILVKC